MATGTQPAVVFYICEQNSRGFSARKSSTLSLRRDIINKIMKETILREGKTQRFNTKEELFMHSNVHGKRDTARPASVSSLAPRFTGSTLKGKKSRVSLALAVSLWIATGGTLWAPTAEAANITIDAPPSPIPTGLMQGTLDHSSSFSLFFYPESASDTWTLNYTAGNTAIPRAS